MAKRKHSLGVLIFWIEWISTLFLFESLIGFIPLTISGGIYLVLLKRNGLSSFIPLTISGGIYHQSCIDLTVHGFIPLTISVDIYPQIKFSKEFTEWLSALSLRR